MVIRTTYTLLLPFMTSSPTFLLDPLYLPRRQVVFLMPVPPLRAHGDLKISANVAERSECIPLIIRDIPATHISNYRSITMNSQPLVFTSFNFPVTDVPYMKCSEVTCGVCV